MLISLDIVLAIEKEPSVCYMSAKPLREPKEQKAAHFPCCSLIFKLKLIGMSKNHLDPVTPYTAKYLSLARGRDKASVQTSLS